MSRKFHCALYKIKYVMVFEYDVHPKLSRITYTSIFILLLGLCGCVSSYDKITVEICVIIYIFFMKLIHFNML